MTDCVKHTTRSSVEKTCLSTTVKLTAARNMAPKHAHKEKTGFKKKDKKKEKSSVSIQMNDFGFIHAGVIKETPGII